MRSGQSSEATHILKGPTPTSKTEM